MVDNRGGIYCIRNLINNHIYIGQATNFRIRKNSHWYRLRSGKHHSLYLQNAYDLYGEENFVLEILLYCEEFDRTRYEQELVDRLKPEYNMCKECVDTTRGYKHTDESKKKMSIAHLLYGPNPKCSNSGSANGMYGVHRYGEDAPMFGKTFVQSEEAKIKISNATSGSCNANFGKPMPEETKEKISLAHIGMKASEETKKKMSEIHSNPSEETRKKLSEATSGENNPMYGKNHTEETKQKISESLKGMLAGDKNPMFGKNHSEETKNTMSKIKSGIKRKNSSSKYIGVCWDTKSKKWMCRFTVFGIKYYLGLFKDEKDAARAYNNKVIELLGDDAKLNIIE